ncbi:HlyC/CorC family transporter [Pelagibius sp. Alg239-R121]|uniref:HlyC/CorC family transporter n=1 Tax=Pelagibius sp. Alg239-R121 TaxID=2993448 RepID=UPI0024A6C9F9|nr:HlyC/CorC family transporter [Pelagibius sp. Alg239-R121]
METELIIALWAIVALLVISAFFSGSETSLTAASRPRMHTLEQDGNHRAAVVNRLWERKERLIGAILLGNNLVNISASALTTSLMIGWFGEAGVAYATLGMTLLVLIFAEVLPKTYALHNADKSALAVAPLLRPIVLVLGPITLTIQWIVRSTLKLFGIDLSASLAEDVAEEELRGAIDLHSGIGEEIRHERQMLRSILDLGDVEVEEIMTHRKNVVAIDVDQPPAKIVDDVLTSPYTRLPLWQGDSDNIVGVLHAKALLRAVQANPSDLESLDVGSIAAKAWFIPESTDLLSQLQAFRSRHEHFAIVVDEYGEVLGIVTLEDILEEIVGDIADEHDVDIDGVQLEKDGSLLVDGEVTIRDLNRQFEWYLPDEEASTIAGLVLHEARRIPDIGQVFVFHGCRFEIVGRMRNQITSIKIERLPDGASTGAAEPTVAAG